MPSKLSVFIKIFIIKHHQLTASCVVDFSLDTEPYGSKYVALLILFQILLISSDAHKL